MAEVQKPIVPSRLFRYRSLTREEDAVEQELDSILKKYLFCSAFTRMNDPMEGFYRPSRVLSGMPDYGDIVREITTGKSNVGIACFTETYEDVLMWTHYAGNYAGMCLSYSAKELLAGLPHHASLARVAYVDEPPLVFPSQVSNASNAATYILSQKKLNWAYEREWRVLGPVGPVKIGRVQAVKAIYFGSRVNLQHRRRILSRIQGTDIRAYMMEVDGYDHFWEPINVAARAEKKKA
jgi:hypothetical protein